MRVWVLECGCYNDRYIAGVYASAQRAMDEHPVTPDKRAVYNYTTKTYRPTGWTGSDEDGWENRCDWDDAMRLIPFDVILATPPQDSGDGS